LKLLSISVTRVSYQAGKVLIVSARYGWIAIAVSTFLLKVNSSS